MRAGERARAAGWIGAGVAACATVLAGAAVLSLGACKARPAPQERSSVMAAYGVRKLRTELPSSVRVPAVIAAADAALRDRGYGVTLSHATEDSGRVEAEPRTAGVLKSVVVMAKTIPDGTRVEVLVTPWGSEAKSRSILDGILVRLGL